MSGVESFIPGMEGVTEKYAVTGPGDQLGVSMTSATNTYLQPTGEAEARLSTIYRASQKMGFVCKASFFWDTAACISRTGSY